MIPDTPRWRRRLRPRFSLRTLVLFTLLATCAYGLWWRWEPWALAMTLDGHDAAVEYAQFSPDGLRALTASPDGTARVWDGRSGRCLHEFDCHDSRAAWSPDGSRIITVVPSRSRNDAISLWDADTGKRVALIDMVFCWNAPHAFSPDGRLIAAHNRFFGIRIIDASDGREVALIPDWAASAGFDFSPDGKRIMTGGPTLHDNTLRECDVRTGRCLRELEWIPKHCSCDSYSRDGSQILVGEGNDSVGVWNLAKRSRAYAFDAFWWTFSPDGTRILIYDFDSGLSIRAVRDGTEIAALDLKLGAFSPIGFSPDGLFVCTGAQDGLLQLRDARTLEIVTVLGSHHGPELHDAQFSPDGRRIVTVSADGLARIWERRRPEHRWGVLCTKELWLTALFTAALAWSIIRDRQAFRPPENAVTSPAPA